ncbi:hypothetical protein SDC9_94176 [bioreactor metagenome]|uniref:Uncharacterized protein n=1 Tax=bioreactor metagenome TaxID=1076179 RepID=A0A645A3F1_9ZZZZ
MQTIVGSLDMHLPLIADLSSILLINDTGTNFITSDNPVIFYNYIAPNYSKYKYTNTVAVSGFMAFCPITEKLLILLYDDVLYQIYRHSQTTIRVEKTSDIDSINILQVVNCSEEIYCYDESEIDYIKNLYSKVEKYRKEPSVINNELDKKHKYSDAIRDKTCELQFIEPYYKMRLSFLEFNEKNIITYKKISRYKNEYNIPSAVMRDELRRELNK